MLDDAASLGEVDQLAQFHLGRERAVPEALAGRDRIADEDQQRRQRSEDNGEQAGDSCGSQRDAVRVLAAQRSWADTDEDVADGGHHRAGYQDRGPVGAEQRDQHDGDDHRREQLAGHP